MRKIRPSLGGSQRRQGGEGSKEKQEARHKKQMKTSIKMTKEKESESLNVFH